ncbi:MAG: biotin/lipoyl-binding protein [Chloroflexi bacterium]|nr:biotin/lipoyl-binding protein [Chloroflexota bacterium]
MKTYIATVNGREFRVEIVDERHVKVNGQTYEVDFTNIGGRPLYSLLASGRSFEANVHGEGDLWQVLLRGRLYTVQVEDERERVLRARAGVDTRDKRPQRIPSPMPGLIVEVRVQPGDTVSKGATLLILESMKMQNEIKAPRDGVVAAVFVQAGQSVNQGEALVQLE